MNSADGKAEFRVEKADLPRLADALHIPAVFHCEKRRVSVLSLITNEVMDFIYDNHCHLVTEWNRDVPSSVALQKYADTISRKGSLNNCFGFIDGTV